MKTNKITKIILTLVFFFAVSGMFAQLPVDPDPDPDPVDGPVDPLPIGDYLLPMLVFGSIRKPPKRNSSCERSSMDSYESLVNKTM